MGLFLRKKPESKNSYLEDQKAIFSTEGSLKEKPLEEDYDRYIFEKKTYDDVPTYKADRRSSVNIVVDRNSLGYEAMNPGVQTVDVVKKNLDEELNEIVTNEPIEDIISDKDLDEIEIIDIDEVIEPVKTDYAEPSSQSKLSIFGKNDEPIEVKVHEVDPNVKVKNLEGKVCPKCGAKLSPMAQGCFLCGHKF